MNLLLRIGFAVSLLGSAESHAYLYVHGYRNIPMIGMGFLVQASVSFAVAVLIALGGPWWLLWMLADYPWGVRFGRFRRAREPTTSASM